jgi:hypothetical protein
MEDTGGGADIADLVPERMERIVDHPAALPQRDLHSVRPAEVRAGPGRIEWRWGPPLGVPGAPASDCLFNFLKLADADGVDPFVQYAAIHGVLGLTATGLPGTFDSGPTPIDSDNPEWHFEPVTLWKAYAQSAKKILVLAMAFRAAGDHWVDEIVTLKAAGFKEPDPRDQEVMQAELEHEILLLNPGKDPFHIGSMPTLSEHLHMYGACSSAEEQRKHLMFRLHLRWLGLANIVPDVEWSIGPPKLVLHLNDQYSFSVGADRPRAYWPRNTLFSVLAAELVGTICSDRYVGQCRQCLALLPSQRKVRTDQPIYCASCRLEVRKSAARNSMRKKYARDKAAGAARIDT